MIPSQETTTVEGERRMMVNKRGDLRGIRTGAGKTRRAALLEQIQAAVLKAHDIKDFDPIVALAVHGADPAVPIDLRIAALAKVAPFVHGTVRQVDPETESGPDRADAGAAKAKLARMVGAAQADVERLRQAALIEDAEVVDDGEVIEHD